MGGENSFFKNPLGDIGKSAVKSGIGAAVMGPVGAVAGAVGDVGGGKNSIINKPLGTGSGSVAQGIGLEQPGLAKGELSQADLGRDAMLTGQFENDIKGEGKSLAIEQYKAAQEDALKSSMALQGSVKGVSNPALLSRNVAAASDNQGQELAQQSALMRMQERQAALDSMNQYLAAKQGVALNNAKMQNQATTAANDRTAGIISSGGAALASLSDKNQKKNIKKADEEASERIGEFLDALDSYSFEYKDEKHGQGEKVGVMAQDLEKSSLGEQMVRDTPDGKMVDFGQGFAAILAAQAELKDELDKLKNKRKA